MIELDAIQLLKLLKVPGPHILNSPPHEAMAVQLTT